MTFPGMQIAPMKRKLFQFIGLLLNLVIVTEYKSEPYKLAFFIGTPARIRTWRLNIDLDLVLVECHVVLDFVRLFFGFGVVPGDVPDGFAVDSSVVVRGSSFPWTDSAGL